jgi:DNA-3-methyladenine glycosylase
MGRRSATVARSSEPPGRRLGRAFFDRATTRVARELLGAELHVRTRGTERVVRLVETEAYVRGDPASHAYRGETARNRSMFLAPGTLYVYRIHQVVCANLVTRRREAVLVRAGAPSVPKEGNPSGPGRLCRFLGLRLDDDGTDTTRSSRIFLRGRAADPGPVSVGPRVGVGRAVDRRLRFALANDPWVSRPRPGARGRR